MTFTRLVGVFAVVVFTQAPALAEPPAKAGPRIKIQVSGDWGESSSEDVVKVCESAASELLAYVPDRKFDPILLKYQEGVPITLYEKGKAGSIRFN